MRFLLSLIFAFSIVGCPKRESIPLINESAPLEVPFKYPTTPSDDFAKTLAKNANGVAVILGAGPAGLLGALALEKTNKFSHILIIENRKTFSRNNTISLHANGLAKMKELGALDRLNQVAIFSQDFRFFIRSPKGEKLIAHRFEKIDEPVDWSKSVETVFDGPGWPHHAVEISQFQRVMAEQVRLSDKVFLLNGEGLVQKRNGRSDVQFKSSSAEYSDFMIAQPNLIVVAEGARSKTRDQLGIGFKRVEKEDENYCSGTISLDGIFSQTPGHISLINDDVEKKVIFGAFRPHSNDLFLNGTFENKEETVENCMKRSAYRLLKQEQQYLSPKLPASMSDLVVKKDKYGRVDLVFHKAERFVDGDNIILIGDAAGNGSPIGGLGASLVASVYMDALSTLANNLSPQNRLKALSTYAKRVDEIVDYWHFSLTR